MESTTIRLAKNIYSIDVIRAAVLSFRSGACQIDNEGDQWLVDFSSIKATFKNDVFLRRLDEFSLRANLELKFSAERDAIITLAFGQQ